MLDAVGGRATFFPIARRAAARPDLIARMRAAGHTIGLHCDQHVRHGDRDPAWVRRDTGFALGRLTTVGVTPTLWRTPWGDTRDWSVGIADEHRLTLVGWTIDTQDWRGDRAEVMFENTYAGLSDGAVVLAHDGLGPGSLRTDAAETVRYVELVADHARRHGLRLEALP